MANPRYPDPRRRGSRDDDKMEQLASLAQLLAVLQRPGIEQQGQDSQMMMNMLQLLQQGSHQDAVLGGQEADRALRREESQADRSLREKEFSDRGAQVAGQMNAQAAELALKQVMGQQELEGRQALAQQEMQNRLEQEKIASSRALVANLSQNPNVSPELLMELGIAAGAPGVDGVLTRMRDNAVQTQVQQLQATLGPVYSQFGENPDRAQAALDMLWKADPRLQSPAIQTAIQPWLDQQNAALAPQPGTAAPQTPVPTSSRAGAGFGNFVAESLYAPLDIPSIAYNNTLVPTANFLSGMFGIPGQATEMPPMTPWIRQLGLLPKR